nr:sulfite exporter TauE/SafE family protein [Fundidesulfovibrio terrae]
MGFGAGAFGTLIGAGGGFVLMPILMVLYPGDPAETLTSISLAVVFFNALSGTEAYALARRIDYRSALLFSAAALPGAVLGALNTSAVPRRAFDALFGVLLLAGAAFLAFRRPAGNSKGSKIPGKTVRTITDAHGNTWTYRFSPALGAGLSMLVGYASSFLGIGGGIIHVPLMVYLLGFPVHVATATSHCILAAMSLSGVMTHIITGAFHQGVHRTTALAIGVVIGAQLGARLSERVGGGAIVRLLAGGLGLLGVRVLLLATGVWK